MYARLSLDKKGDQLGVERQEAECREYAAARGWTVSKVYVDNDLSASGDVYRPAFEEMLTDRPEHIVVWHNDRLTRKSAKVLERILETGCMVHALKAGEFALDTPTGRALARTVTAWAQNEVELKAERQRAEMFQRAQRGLPNWIRRPFGFNTDLSLREDEAAAIREAYTDTLRGVSRHEIARRWNAAGLLTPGVRSSDKKREADPTVPEWRTEPSRWIATNVRMVLRSPRNAGLREYRGKIIGPAAWEPIVDRETWDGVQALLDRSKSVRQGRGREVVSLLSGIARCPKGHPIVGAGMNGQSELTYRCTETCVTNVPRSVADAHVWSQAVLNVLPARREAWKGQTTNDAAKDALNARLAVVRGKLAKAAEMWARDLLTDDQLQATTATLKDEEKALKAELGTLPVMVHPVTGDSYADVALTAAMFPPADLTLAQCRATLRDLAVVTIRPRGKGCRKAYDPTEFIEVADRLTRQAGAVDTPVDISA